MATGMTRVSTPGGLHSPGHASTVCASLVRLVPLELLGLDRALELVRVLGRLGLALPRELELLLLRVLTRVQLLVGELACVRR